MNNFSSQKKQSSFRGDVLRLVSGTGLAQMITLLASPVIARMYIPEFFGVTALFVSITTVISVMASLRYDLAIVLPESDREAANILGLSLLITLVIAGLTGLIILLSGSVLVDLLNAPDLAPFLWLIPLMVLLNGIFNALNYWNTRTKKFTRLSISRVLSQSTTTSTRLIAGAIGRASSAAMLSAAALGAAVSTLVLGGQILRDDGRFILRNLACRDMWACVKRYRKFPIFEGPGSILNSVSWQVPVLMLGAFFSDVVVGYYSQGFRMIQMPMGLIGGAIAQVFFQRGAEANNSGQLPQVVTALFQRLLIIGALPSLILMLVGEDLFAFVFGQRWSEAGVYAQILAPWALVWFISSPLSTIFLILEKQKEILLIQIMIFLTRIISIYVGGYLGQPRLALVLFSLSGIISYGYLVGSILYYSKVSISDQLWFIARRVGIAALCVIPVVFAKYALNMASAWVFALSILIILIYLYYHRYVFRK